jgi:DNA-binding IclR family transcriptional regulator
MEDVMIRDADAIDADVLRIRHQFLSKPDLVLTVGQIASLYDLSRAHAQRLLDTLESEGFLVGGASGIYRRATPTISDQP